MSRRKHRKAAAVVEMALCMPFVFLIIVGSVELSAGLFHQHTLRLVVHECAITAAHGEGTCDEVQEKANAILSQRGFTQYTISIDEETRTENTDSVEPHPPVKFTIPASGSTPAGLENVPRGTMLRLSITADRPQTKGLGFITKLLADDLVADCVFVKEL